MPPLSDDKQLRSQLERTDRDLAACRERLAKAMVFVRAAASVAPVIEGKPPSWQAFVVINVQQVREAAVLVAEIGEGK